MQKEAGDVAVAFKQNLQCNGGHFGEKESEQSLYF